jgi:hypothetical protein
MVARLTFAVFVVAVIGACSAAAPIVTLAPAATSTPAAPSTPSTTVAAPATATPAQPSPTAAAATATPNAPATPSGAVATTSPAASGCSLALTEADIDRGFPLTQSIAYNPNPAFPPPGFEDGTQVQFESGLETGDEVVSTVMCFDSPENARSQFDQLGGIEGGCVTANFTPVDAQALEIGPIPGADDSKGTLCKADKTAATSIAGSASLYVLRGPVVFSVSFNQKDLESAPVDVITTIAEAAAALAARLGGG